MAGDAPAIASMVASAEDLRQVSPLEIFPLDRSTVLHWILNRDAGWVVEDHGEVVAYGELVPDQTRSDRFWIGHMIVHPRRRGLGIGQRLVHGLVRIADADKDARVVAISAFADNPRALRCYESCGFVRVDQERIEGRLLVGMRLKFRSRRRSPGPGMLAVTGSLAAAASLGAFRSFYPAAFVTLGMVSAALLSWRLAGERRDPWSQRVRRSMLMVGTGFAGGLVAALFLQAFVGGATTWIMICGSATLIWIALLALVLKLQN